MKKRPAILGYVGYDEVKNQTHHRAINKEADHETV